MIFVLPPRLVRGHLMAKFRREQANMAAVPDWEVESQMDIKLHGQNNQRPGIADHVERID